MGKDAPGRRDRRVGIEDLARCREELSLSLSLPSPIFNRATLDVVLTPPPRARPTAVYTVARIESPRLRERAVHRTFSRSRFRRSRAGEVSSPSPPLLLRSLESGCGNTNNEKEEEGKGREEGNV